MPCGCRRCPVCVRACEKPRVFLWGCVGLGRECFGYAKAPWGVCSKEMCIRDRGSRPRGGPGEARDAKAQGREKHPDARVS